MVREPGPGPGSTLGHTALECLEWEGPEHQTDTFIPQTRRHQGAQSSYAGPEPPFINLYKEPLIEDRVSLIICLTLSTNSAVSSVLI